MSTERHVAPVSVLAALCLLMPLAFVCALSVQLLVGWVRGTNPHWDSREITLSEAAMVRDNAEVVRLIRAGVDPNRTWPVREDLSDSHRPENLTPLEAAVQIRRLELVRLLLREGARLDGGVREALISRAREVHADDVAVYLEREAGIP